MDFDVAAFGIWYIVFLLSTVAHEAAHGLVAHLGGDSTAYQGGRVTLDPVTHIKASPVGMVLVPLITFFQMGWMMGWASVPFDSHWGKRHPRRQALMSLAGPTANLTLCLLGVIAIWALVTAGVLEVAPSMGFDRLVQAPGPVQPGSLLSGLAMGLSVLVTLNLALGLFNLVPFPPLDGAGVLEGFFPRSLGRLYEYLQSIPILGLVGLLLAWNVFPVFFLPALLFVFDLVAGI
jgi:Zn-dependent protease